MKTDTQNATEPRRRDLQMSRRQMIKTVGAGAGVAAVGSGALSSSSTTGTVRALPEIAEALGPTTAFGGLQMIENWLGGSADVDEDQNTVDYVWNTANTIASLRSGPTGDRTEIQNEFIDAADGQSAFAEASGSAVVSAAARKTFEGESDKAEQAAQDALNEHATRSIINICEMWNSAHLRMIESGALVEDYEEDTGVVKTENGTALQPVTKANLDDPWKVVEGTSPEGSDGYLVHKVQLPASDLPMDPTNLEGREKQLEVYSVSVENSTPQLNIIYQPVGGTAPADTWFNEISNGGTGNYTKENLRAQDNDLGDITWVDAKKHRLTIDQIASEYTSISNDLSSVVDETVQGLEQGDIEPSDVLTGESLLKEYDPNSDREQLAREMMAIGMDMPGDPAFQAKVSHPSLEADSLWGDLYIRLSTDSDVSINGPMTLPSADYSHALIGYTGSASGDYITQVLPGNSDLEILEIETQDQQVVEVEKTVGENGTVPLAPAESEDTPEPLADPDPKFDEWGLGVFAADGSSWKGTVGDAYIDGDTWKVDTSLSQGLTVERIHYNPPSTFKRTSYWTPGGSTYDVETTEKVIERRRKLNEAIEEEFSSVIGGGGFFDDLPSLPGLGVIESAVVVILAIFGLNAASG